MLPPRTEEEEKAIELMEDFLDNYDYTGETKPIVTQEMGRLISIGLERRHREELEDMEQQL